MDKPDAQQRARDIAEGKFHIFYAAFVSLTLPKETYCILIQRKYVGVWSFEEDRPIWHMIGAVILIGLLYMNLWALKGQCHRENPIRPLPMMLTLTMTATLMLYIASLIALYLNYILSQI